MSSLIRFAGFSIICFGFLSTPVFSEEKPLPNQENKEQIHREEIKDKVEIESEEFDSETEEVPKKEERPVLEFEPIESATRVKQSGNNVIVQLKFKINNTGDLTAAGNNVRAVVTLPYGGKTKTFSFEENPVYVNANMGIPFSMELSFQENPKLIDKMVRELKASPIKVDIGVHYSEIIATRQPKTYSTSGTFTFSDGKVSMTKKDSE